MGYSEYFADFRYEKQADTDFICFTDDRTLTSDFWTFIYCDTSQTGPVLAAKLVKICAHRFLQTYDESLWVDNTVRIVASIPALFKFLSSAASPFVCFAHPDRDCIYDEAKVVADLRLDDPEVVGLQMDAYRKRGHPEHAGLVAATVLLRKHNDPAIVSLMEAWFAEVAAHSYRIQLSFDYVARARGFKPSHFPYSLYNNPMIQWPVLVRNSRVPRGFRDEAYLALNPDVAGTGMTAREHYLKVGFAEKRPYEVTDQKSVAS